MFRRVIRHLPSALTVGLATGALFSLRGVFGTYLPPAAALVLAVVALTLAILVRERKSAAISDVSLALAIISSVAAFVALLATSAT
jgi:hypothetical protein